MKIPEMKSQRHKLRDCAICNLLVDGEFTIEAIARRFNLSARQISRVIYKNRSVIKIDKEYERLKRVRKLKSWMGTGEKTKKDPADILTQLKNEIDGDTPLVDNSKHQHYTVVKFNEVQELDESAISTFRKNNSSLAKRSS